MNTASSPSRWLLPVLFLGVLMAAMDIAIVGPALPAIREALATNDRLVAWVFTAYLLLNLVGTPIMAKLADRFGRRPIYILDVLLFVLGSLIAAMAPSIFWLILGRAVQGFGSGGIFPVAAAVIGDVVPEERRGRTLGLIGAVFGLAFLVGPIIGGILLRFSWRWIFWGPLPLAVVLVPAAWKVLPTTRAAQPKPWDGVGTLLMAAALASWTLGLNQLDAQRPLQSLTQGSAGGVILLGLGLAFALLRWERNVPDPVFPLSSVRHPLARLTLWLSFGAGVLEGGAAFLPTLLVVSLDIAPHTASFMLVPVALSLAAGAPLFGFLLDRIGPRRVMVMGTSMLVVGLALLGWVRLSQVSFYPAAVLTGLGLSALLGAPVRYLMLLVSSPQERASTQALISVVTKIGQMLSAAVIGAVAASFGGGSAGYTSAYRLLAVLAIGLVLLAFRVPQRRASPPTA